jgi:hypothetical protein
MRMLAGKGRAKYSGKMTQAAQTGLQPLFLVITFPERAPAAA